MDTLTWDADRDVLQINSVQYAVQMFRALALASPGTWLRVEERDDGVLTLYQPADTVAATLDAITGRGLPK